MHLRSSSTKVDSGTKRSIFSALSSHITARDTDDAETLSVLLDVLLLLREDLISRSLGKGPFTNDVCREGERGGYPNSDAVREVV